MTSEDASVYDDVERLTLEEYGERIEEDVLRQVEYVYDRGPFYQEKYDSAGVDVDAIRGLDDVTDLPFTEKDPLRESQAASPPFGRHRCCDVADIEWVYTSSGTTGAPTFIGLTASDLDHWSTVGARAAYAAGVRPTDTTVGVIAGGPFAAAVTYDAHQRLGATVAPVGPGQTDRIIAMFEKDCGSALLGTPSYAEYFLEQVRERGLDPGTLGVDKILVGGEPGTDDVREEIESAFDCIMTESMGNGDMSISIWGECTHQNGMHFTGHSLVYPELIDPETGEQLEWTTGAQGELVYTAINRECVPLVRFRTRDHVVVTETDCACGRGSPCIRGLGRTDDMFIVRGVNVFPSAVKDVVTDVEGTTGHLRIYPEVKDGQSVRAPVEVTVEATDDPPDDLVDRLERSIRDRLQFRATVTVVSDGTLDRSEYKSQLVEFQ